MKATTRTTQTQTVHQSHRKRTPASVLEMEPLSITDSIRAPKLALAIHLDAHSSRREVMQQLDRVCTGLARHESTSQHLKQTLGRIMAAVEDRELYRPQYEHFEEFRLAIADKYHLSRATVSACLTMVRAFDRAGVEPSPEQIERIPDTNLALAARVVGKLPKAEAQRLFKEAEEPIAQFRKRLEKRHLVARVSKSVGELISFRTSKRIAKALRAFVGDQDWGQVLFSLLPGDGKRNGKQGRLKLHRGASKAA